MWKVTWNKSKSQQIFLTFAEAKIKANELKEDGEESVRIISETKKDCEQENNMLERRIRGKY